MTAPKVPEVVEPYGADVPPPADEKKKEPSAATVLVDLALERYGFGCTEDGEPFATPLPAGHVVRTLRGGRTSLRAELAKAYRERTGKIAGQQALADALLVLEGEAQDTDPQPVHLRVGEHRGVVWIDLGDADEHAVRVDASGWQVVARGSVPVLFRRTALTAPLPVPTSGGDLAGLWDLLNVAAADRPLVLAWLVAALADPAIPHPVLALLGEQGTGKSTACRTVVQLVDPSPVPLRKAPKDADGWVTAAAGSWVVGLDNLSVIPDWLSDTLCRAVTGDGDVRRQLYTDSGLSVFAFRRALVLNGIDLGALRSDLADRAILVNLDVIDEHSRLTERQLDAAWATAWPSIFGALLTEVAGVLARRPSVRLGTSPRMADFAVIVAALDELHNTTALAAYAEQARNMAADAVTSDPFLAALADHGQRFEGTAAELRTLLAPLDDKGRAPLGWPKSARAVTSLVKRSAPALRKLGWTVAETFSRTRTVIWQLDPPREGREASPATPATPAPGVFSQVSEPTRPAESAGHAGQRTPSADSEDLHDTTPNLQHLHPTGRVPAGQPRGAGHAGVAGDVSRPSQVVTCPECGEPLSAAGLLARCRPNHRTEIAA